MLSSYQRIVLIAWLSRLVTVAAQLLAVRALLGVLGVNAFAAWTLLTSLTGWFLLADFGLAQATQNKVSRLIAQGRPAGEAVRAAVRGVIVAGLLVLGLLLASSIWLGPWLLQHLLGPQTPAALVFTVAVLLLVPSAWSAVAAKIWYAQGQGLRANVVPAVAALLALACATWLPGEVSDPLPRLLVALACWLLPPALAGTISLLWIYGRAEAAPGPRRWMPEWRPALAFWVYATLGIVTLNVDYMILGQTVPPAALVGYSLLAKIFGFLFFFYSATLAIYSPRVSAAKATGSLQQLYGIVRRHMRISAVSLVLFCTLLWWVLPWVFQHIFGTQELEPSLPLYLGFSTIYLVRIWADGNAMLLSAMDEVHVLGRLLPLQAAISVCLQWWWAMSFGALGIIAGLLASYLLTVSWALPVAIQRLTQNVAAGGQSTHISAL